MTEPVPSNSLLSDTDLRALVQAYARKPPAVFSEQVFMCLQELVEKRGVVSDLSAVNIELGRANAEEVSGLKTEIERLRRELSKIRDAGYSPSELKHIVSAVLDGFEVQSSHEPPPPVLKELVTRLRQHAALHDDLAANNDEQLQWRDDLLAAADLLVQSAHEPPAVPSVEPIARVINNNQPGWTNVVETAPNVTLDVGAPLYSRESVMRLAAALAGAIHRADQPPGLVEGLREKLRVYGGHIPPCPGRPCECGFQLVWDECGLGSTKGEG